MQEAHARATELSIELLTSLAQSLSKRCIKEIGTAAKDPISPNALPNLISHAILWTIGFQYHRSQGEWLGGPQPSSIQQAMTAIHDNEHDFLDEFSLALMEITLELREQDLAHYEQSMASKEAKTVDVEMQQGADFSFLSKAVPETFSRPMFTADSVETTFRSALDLAGAEFMMQKQEGTPCVGVENGPVVLGALQKSKLAHSVATLTISAVKSSFLPDAKLMAQWHDHAENALPTNAGVAASHSDVFRDGACFAAFPNLPNKWPNEESYLHEGTSSFNHTVLCAVPTTRTADSTPPNTIVFNTSFNCGTDRGEQI